ncbi:MAG TPA: enediyne biosynthesis protein [Streptosporangiaceae bacterium]|nr:enediyne biosynthesis protein [Streptosporangiaceae bacterium]
MTTTAPADGRSAPLAQPPAEPAKIRRPNDPRYLALRNFAVSISAFNVLGYSVLGFEQPWLWPILAVLAGYLTEIGFEVISAWAQQRSPRFTGRGPRGFMEFLLPAHITGLVVNMLLYANNQFWPVLFGVVVAVAQKHVLQAPIAGRMRHFMNPSNFGIVIVLLLFSRWVAISPPYMFTEWANTFFKLLIPLVILGAGTLINATLTKRIPLIVGWAGGFVIQALVRHWIWDVQLNTALGVLSGVAFVLFTNYMITDPGTTPTKPRPQFIFGGAVAAVYGLLMAMNIVYTLFLATVIVCACRGLGWWTAYLWQQEKKRRATRLVSGTASPGSCLYARQQTPGADGMTIDVDPDVHARLAAAAAAAATAAGRPVSYCDVIRELLKEAGGPRDLGAALEKIADTYPPGSGG